MSLGDPRILPTNAPPLFAKNQRHEVGLPLAILEHVLSNAQLSTHSTPVQKVGEQHNSHREAHDLV
jgi:hypothetical protein